MKEYTYSEARQRLATLLEEAQRDGAVRIRRKDGQLFTLRVETSEKSPLDVQGADLGVTREEILCFIREGRREA